VDECKPLQPGPELSGTRGVPGRASAARGKRRAAWDHRHRGEAAQVETDASACIRRHQAYALPPVAVQVDPMQPTLNASGAKRWKLHYDEALSHSALIFNVRRNTVADDTQMEAVTAAYAVARTRMEQSNFELIHGRAAQTVVPDSAQPVPPPLSGHAQDPVGLRRYLPFDHSAPRRIYRLRLYASIFSHIKARHLMDCALCRHPLVQHCRHHELRVLSHQAALGGADPCLFDHGDPEYPCAFAASSSLA